MSATRDTARLSLLDVLVSAVNPNESVIPELLPVADAQVAALLDDGLTDHAVEAHIEKVARAGCKSFTPSLAKFHAWEQASNGGAAVHDPIDNVMIATRDAAFVLGLALGLRIGGAR